MTMKTERIKQQGKTPTHFVWDYWIIRFTWTLIFLWSPCLTSLFAGGCWSTLLLRPVHHRFFAGVLDERIVKVQFLISHSLSNLWFLQDLSNHLLIFELGNTKGTSTIFIHNASCRRFFPPSPLTANGREQPCAERSQPGLPSCSQLQFVDLFATSNTRPSTRHTILSKVFLLHHPLRETQAGFRRNTTEMIDLWCVDC